jgi:DNA-directed RNA polymerase specialized sigma24 family protein
MQDDDKKPDVTQEKSQENRPKYISKNSTNYPNYEINESENAPDDAIAELQADVDSAHTDPNHTQETRKPLTKYELDQFEIFYKTYYQYILGKAKSFCYSIHNAYTPEDLTQDTFTKFSKYLPSFLSKAKQYPKAYLNKICESLFFNFVSKKSIKVSLALDDIALFIPDTKPTHKNYDYFSYPEPHYIGYINDVFKDNPKLKNILLTLPQRHLQAYSDLKFGQLKTPDLADQYQKELMTVLGWIRRAKIEIRQRYRHVLEVPDHYYHLPLRHTQKNLVKKGPYWFIRKLVDDHMLLISKIRPAKSADWKAQHKELLELECNRLDQEDALVLFIKCAIFINISEDILYTILNNQHTQLELQGKRIEKWRNAEIKLAQELAREIIDRLNIKELFKKEICEQD